MRKRLPVSTNCPGVAPITISTAEKKQNRPTVQGSFAWSSMSCSLIAILLVRRKRSILGTLLNVTCFTMSSLRSSSARAPIQAGQTLASSLVAFRRLRNVRDRSEHGYQQESEIW